MDLKDLQVFIKKENLRLRDNYYADYDDEKRIYSATVKMVEEVGELCDAVLKNQKVQRTSKMEGFEKSHLEQEVADVIITAMLLADLLGVDAKEALSAKIEKIIKRYDKNGKECVGV